ncbi:hypothetical protein ACFV2U_39890 [Streptomyces sp. NPDC059697]|uniref:hypothetical protein n=1 Tax=Streptomyces sp. NPDC059697 TaxID=3346912 RepID=UPI0036B7DCB7
MKPGSAGSERTLGRVLGKRAVIAVLAAAVAAGVLIPLVVLRLAQGASSGSPGSAGSPQQVAAPRLHPLRQTVAGERVTSVAAGNGVVVYGTEDGGVYVTSAHAGPRRITVLAGRVVKLAFDSRGRWLAAISARSELAVVDTAHAASPVIRHRIRTDSPPGLDIPPDQLAIDPTGSRIAAQTGRIGIYDLHGNPSPHWLDGTYECSGARDMAFVGTEFIAAFDNCANIWNASTLRMERQVYFPSTGNALVGHGRILYGTLSHALLLDYRTTSPLPSAAAAPGQPHPTLGNIIADKTISTRRSPIQPVADDGRVAAVLHDARLTFWEPASRRILTTIALPFPATCASTTKPAPPAQFSTSFSPDHKTLVIAGFCPPASLDSSTEEGRRHSTYRRWMLAYPSLRR